MLVWNDRTPAVDASDASKTGDSLKLLVTAEVVADVMEVDSATLRRLRVLDQQRDGDRRTTPAAEDLSSFLPRRLTTRPLITSQVGDVQARELVH